MKTTWILTKSTIKMFIRNRQSVFFTLFMPVIIMTIFGLVGIGEPQKIDVGLPSNLPANSLAEQLAEQIKQVEVFNVKTGTQDELRTGIENGDYAAAFLIPPGLSPTASDESGDKTITALVNVGESQQSQAAVNLVSQMIDKATLGVYQVPSLFNLNPVEINSRNLSYFDFLLPGVVALAIMQMAVFSVAFVFADYKEKGILKRLIATPMRPFQFVTANVITRLIVAIVQSAVLIALGVLIFHAHVIGSYLLVFLIILLGAIMFLGLGFTISGIASTVESVPAIANLIVFPMLFLGGTFFPISAMPNWLQKIVQFLPLTYFSDSLRQVMTKGVGPAEIRTDLIAMAVWSVVLIFLANITFGFEEKRV